MSTQISEFLPAQVATLSPAQIAAFSYAQIAAMTPTQIAAIWHAQMAYQAQNHYNALKFLADNELSKTHKRRNNNAKTTIPTQQSGSNTNTEPAITSVENAQLQPDPIICPLCNESFSLRHDFYHHSNAQHREKIEKNWHQCLQCLWYFPTKKSARDHGCTPPGETQLQPDVKIKKEPINQDQEEIKNADSQDDHCMSNKSDSRIIDKNSDTSHSQSESEESHSLSNKSGSKCFEHLKKIDIYERACFSNNNDSVADLYKGEAECQLNSQR